MQQSIPGHLQQPGAAADAVAVVAYGAEGIEAEHDAKSQNQSRRWISPETLS